MTEETFAADEVRQGDVLYRLGIIGEAAGQVPEHLRDRYEDIPWRRLRETRNVVAHAYFGVNMPRIWRLAARDLPRIAERLQAMLDAEDAADP